MSSDRPPSLSDHPGFWLTWSAFTVSSFGSYVTSLAVGVLVVVNLDGGSTQVGLVNAASWAPYLLFGLVAGAIVDRVRRRPLLVAADLVRAVVLVLIPVLALNDLLSIWLLALLMATVGLMALIHNAAFQAFIPRLVPGPMLTPAHARFDQSDAVAQASGPAIAGGLVSLVGAPLAVLVDAVSFLVSGLLISRVDVEEPPTRKVSVRSMPAEMIEGLRWVYRHTTLRPLALSTHGWFLCSAIAGAVVTPYALLTLGLSPLTLGVALAVAGVGALIGSLVSVRLGARFGAGPVIIVCRIAAAVAFATVAFSSQTSVPLAVFALGQLILGLEMGAENANQMGYQQTVTPDRLQGRMNASMRTLNRSMIVIGAPIGGVLGDRFGFATVLWSTAGAFLLVGGALALTRFRHAHLGDPYAQPAPDQPR